MLQGLSVVIPNYNGIALFPHTLPSVFSALDHTGLPYEVIVVDDCSTDDSIAWLRANYPVIRLLKNERNSGFSVTANKGIRAASHDKVLLLNSDVKLERSYFEHLQSYFDDPLVFGVMGRIIGWDDDIIQDGAKFPSFHKAKIKTNLNYLLCNEAEMEGGLLSMYVSGANALLDRQKFLHAGGFNELFSPFYVEDYELSLRAWRLGWKCMYEHRAVCRHRTSTSIQAKSRKNFIRTISLRNKWYLHSIHLEGRRRMLWWIQLVPEILVQLLLFKTFYFKALVLFVKTYGGVRKSRAALKQLAGKKELLCIDLVASAVRDSIKGKKARYF